jgi:ABC-2 type transport system permease protein
VSTAERLVRQVRYENKSFWRNPAAALFTILFPLLFLVIFTGIFGDDTSGAPGGLEVDNTTYYIPAILSFAVITACYTNTAMSVVFARENGILKRVRGTPLPSWLYLSGKVLHSMLVMALLTVVVIVFGAIAYDLDVPGDTTLPFAVSVLVGSAAFCALGLAVTSIIPNADAAPAIVNATIFPLLFISGTFIPTDDAPQWMQDLAELFPVRHFVETLFAGYGLSPIEAPDGWLVGDLLVVAAWGAAGLLIAIRFFRWEPRR